MDPEGTCQLLKLFVAYPSEKSYLFGFDLFSDRCGDPENLLVDRR